MTSVLHEMKIAVKNGPRCLLQAPEANRAGEVAVGSSWPGASAKPLGLQAWRYGSQEIGRRQPPVIRKRNSWFINSNPSLSSLNLRVFFE